MNDACESRLEAKDAEGRFFSFPCHCGKDHHGDHKFYGGKYDDRFSYFIAWSEFSPKAASSSGRTTDSQSVDGSSILPAAISGNQDVR